MSGMPDPTTALSPLATPIGRRRALAVIGSSLAGMVLLEGCGPGSTPTPRGWVQADVDPDALELSTPVSVKFGGSIDGTSLTGSAWLVLREADEPVAFDPRCTHALCTYELTDEKTFSSLCHDAFFALDGKVLSGPPPRPLDEFPVRVMDGRIELYVPGDFSTPRPDA